MKIDIIIAYVQRYEFGHERDFVPPITGIHLAAVTPAKHEVRVFHQQIDQIELNTEAEVIAISFFSGFAMAAYDLAVEFRKRGKILVAGGPHVTYCQEEALSYFDSIVTGEAENVWPNLLQDIEFGQLKRVYAGTPCDMTGLPTPRYDLLPNRFFIKKVIQATRGCPFSCSFCTVPSLNPGFRLRPVEDVIRDASYDQFRHWWQRKIVWFWDDNLTIKRPYIKQLLHEMIPLKKWWLTQASMDIAKDPELLDLMKASGCIGVFLGIESFGIESLADANKRQNKIANYKEAVKQIRKRGIAVMAGFIAGFDHDDEQSIVNMANQLMEIGIDVPFLSIMTPFMGTPIYTKLNQEGRILEERNWSFYNGYNVAFRPKKINEEQLLNAHRELWKKSFSLEYSLKRIIRAMFTLRRGALLLSIFMNSFYAYKRLRKNYPIDMSKRTDVSNFINNQTTPKKLMKPSMSYSLENMMHFFLLVSFLFIASLAGTTAYAQDKAEEVDKVFSWATPDKPGCVCAVSKEGKVVVNRAYGLADIERNVPLNPRSIFDIGSVRKQFIAAAVLILAEEKRLSLTDDIRKYIPELPDYGHAITIDHLLTHTSGLRDWTGLLPLSNGQADVLTLILRQRGLNFVPGEEWSYSNSGYVLLTEIVSHVSGMTFAEFAHKRLFEPLGMKSSSYVPDILQGTGDRALGYQKEGSGWKQYMRLGVERGGGAVISTAGDLLIWNDALTNGRLGGFVTGKIQEPAKLNNGRKLSYARGLNVNHFPGAMLISHSGGAAGYSTWLGRLPEHGLSIAVLCNFDPVSASELAHKVAEEFLPPDTARVKAQTTVTGGASITELDLKDRAGLFFSESGDESMRLVANNGKLSIVGGPALVPVATGRFRNPRGSLFFMSQDEFELQFLSPDQFELNSMEGQVTRYRRARPYAPAPDELKAFAGRFENDEIGTVFAIEPKGGGLVIRLEHAPARSLEFKPVERDIFQWNRMMVHFHRDKAGKVISFSYSNPLIRNIKFTRLSGN